MIFQAYQSVDKKEVLLLVALGFGLDAVPDNVLRDLGAFEFAGAFNTLDYPDVAGIPSSKVDTALGTKGYLLLQPKKTEPQVLVLAVLGAVVGGLGWGATAAVLGGLIGAFVGSKTKAVR
jgi:uncharacterized protein YcgL (UPF0745 family)